MQSIQLYIDGKRVEMFTDESVDITDSIKNAKSVDKVFTEYSQTFSLPASSINNKIFKHYYNNDIIGGFDARVRVSANIELNHSPYKSGFIKLEGVDLIDNKAHTYKITFFGNTISLKNIIGDDLLSGLEWLDNFSEKEDVQNPDTILFNPSDIEDYLTTSLDKTVDGIQYTAPIQVPLLTHSQRLFYNSSQDVLDSGNLDFTAGTNYHGVKWNELKYAIKMPIIIKAIEKKYGINFSTNFFNDNTSWDNLYMWLHRAKGVVTNGGQLNTFNYRVVNWSSDSNDIGAMASNVLTLQNVPQTQLKISLTPTSSTIPYSFTILRDGNVVYSSGTVTGNISSQAIPIAYNSGYTVNISITEALSFTSVNWEHIGFDSETQSTLTKNYTTSAFTIAAEFDFIITQQIPKMKVLDFLTSIFKMFNLVAFVENNQIVVKTLDSFYLGGAYYDITKFIDVNKSQSNVALPFREIIYTYSGLDTYLSAVHNQLFNQKWGQIEYSGDANERFSGEIFDYTIPFEHMKFERLLDLNNNTTKDIQWGYSVDDNQEPYIGKPLLFYMALKTADVSFVDAVDGDNASTSHKEISKHFAPCNSNMNVSAFADQPSLNFDSEPDEWEGVENTNSLFEIYHRNYITGVFNTSNRITKVSAYLPLRILLNYTLADRFSISGKSYKINSIKTNLQSGKSELELLNDYEYVAPATGNSGGNDSGSTAVVLSNTTRDTDSIGISWTTPADATSYNVYLDQSFLVSLGNVSTYLIEDLIDDTLYKIDVRGLNSSGNQIYMSNIIEVRTNQI